MVLFVNLLGNAIHAVEGRNKRDIFIRAFEADERIVIEVEDSGPGIDAVHLENIFDPFYKPMSLTSQKYKTISERILKEMGGDIRADTSPKGAIFIMTLNRATGRNEKK